MRRLDICNVSADFAQANPLYFAPSISRISISSPPTKADAAAEKELQRLCEMELTRHGVEFLHLSHRAREKRGWPDLTFAWKGKPYAVELKTADGKLSVDQNECLRNMEKNGWATLVCRSYKMFAEIFK